MIRPVQAYRISNGEIYLDRDEAVQSEFENVLVAMLIERGVEVNDSAARGIAMMCREFRTVETALKTAQKIDTTAMVGA